MGKGVISAGNNIIQTGPQTDRFPVGHLGVCKLCPSCMMVKMSYYDLNVSVTGFTDRLAIVKTFHNSDQSHVFLYMSRYAAHTRHVTCYVDNTQMK